MLVVEEPKGRKSKLMKWPSFYPEGCPPADAPDASGEVYRLVKSNPPESGDFVSFAEESPARFGENCKGCGLSVFTSKRDAEQLLNRVQGLRVLGKFVAIATLDESHGKLKPTPTRVRQSHHTWWSPVGIIHATLFKVVT